MIAVVGRSPATRRTACKVLIAAIIGIGAATAGPSPIRASAAGPCGPPVVNPVACENTLPGTDPSVWDVGTSTDLSILGFSTDISVNVGQTVHFKVSTTAPAYTVDIYRIGYYQGLGARFISNVPAVQRQTQPSCLTNPSIGLVDCGNWAESASWAVPANAVSGVYIANLTRTDNQGNSHIVFIVRNDASHSAMLFQTADSTWQAYNTYGGSSFYSASTSAGRAFKLSYNRPVTTRNYSLNDNLFYAEYPAIAFFERNGYDISYFSGVDAARYGPLIKNHATYITAGHDEYWSGPQRASVTAARDAGVNLMFLSGNEMFWKTRWENSIDGSGTPYRTIVTYKETHANAVIDPADPPTWTGTWRDPRFSPPADGGLPENALTGQMWTINEGSSSIQVPAQFAPLRFWRNTSVANLTGSQVATLAGDTLGYEWDEEVDNGFRPPGTFDISSTTLSGVQRLTDYGTSIASSTATHHMSLYRAASGALVFGAGTVQWTWGLSANHDGLSAGDGIDARMQQATVNILADMGAQPATLMAGMVAATQSTDTTRPTSVVNPPAPSTLSSGRAVTITGTASDAGGGVVAAVDVSVDGGATWHRAAGRNAWTYAWQASGSGTVVIRSRAVDDSGNLEVPSAGIPVTVNCPCSIWDSTKLPSNTAVNDGSPVELGLKFKSDVDATVTGVRFYKAATNTGTHVGRMWSSAGALLAGVTFTNETPSGWQQATFSNPVVISRNVPYVVSYFAPAGNYSFTSGYLYPQMSPPPVGGSTADNGPIHALRNGPGVQNGLYLYGTSGGFPINSSNATNYWVDVVYKPTTGSSNLPPVVTTEAPADGASNVATSTVVAATFNQSIDPATLTFTLSSASGSQVSATVTYDDPSRTATLRPTSPLVGGAQYNVSVQATSLSGQRMTSPTTWSFITGGLRTCTCTIFLDSQTPQAPPANDSQAVNLGVKFRSDSAGLVTGVRFYKGAGNTGTHVGSLWGSSGTLLASATFSNETSAGWQNVGFSTPVAIAANTTYVASYLAPVGHYSSTLDQFTTSGIDAAPLHALASGIDGKNGVYVYSSANAFPNNSFRSANYWVDVVFETTPISPTAPSVVAQTPAPGASGASVATPVSAKFNVPVKGSGVVVRDANGAVVPGATSYDPVSHTVTFVPATALAYFATYSVTVTATDLNGTPMAAPATWTFATGQASCPCTIFSPAATPAAVDGGDGSAIELGVKFRADTNGYITGVRFYKAAANTGTHLGNLWTSGGILLASAIFSGETTSGWQQVSFPGAVAVTAGTTYIASYFTPAGHYSLTSAGFVGSGVDNAPLHALADGSSGGNGVFHYGSSSTFPASTNNGSNYWVDVVYGYSGTPDTTPPSVVSTIPASGATGASGSSVSAVFSEAVIPGSISFTLSGGGSAIAAAVSYNSTTRTATLVPSSPLAAGATFNASVTASDLAGNAMAAPTTWTFTTAPPNCPCTIFAPAAVPQNVDSGDGSSVELGVKFRADSNGFITGVRFYKAAANTGTHLGNLWTSAGVLLASAVFTAESATGWQQANFSGAVAVSAGTTYVASYFAPAGHFSVTPGGFLGGPVDNPPLHALADGTAGGNGVFNYAASSAFPASSFNGGNYWVDTVYVPSGTPDTTPPSVVATNPTDSAANVGRGTLVAATFNEAVASASIRFTVSTGGLPVAGTVSYDLASRTATLTPSTVLAPATTYTASIGASDLAGNAMPAPTTWSFTTQPFSCPCSVFGPSMLPVNIDGGDGSAIEVGMKFRSDVNATVTAIRFYKAATNTGIHTGNLWTNGGTLLGSVTFSGESASGWQVATLTTPVSITAATTYIVSYFAPVGHYSLTASGFVGASIDNAPLHGLADGSDGPNGVFNYGASSAFPSSTYNGGDYWVDVVTTVP